MWFFKLCVTFHSHQSIQTGVTVRKRSIRIKIGNFCVPCDLEIWEMTLKNNRALLLCCFKLCASQWLLFPTSPPQFAVHHWSSEDIWLVFAWPGTEGCDKMATSTEKYILHICKILVNLHPLVLEKWYTKWIVYVWFMYAIDSILLILNLHLNLSVSTMTLWKQAM